MTCNGKRVSNGKPSHPLATTVTGWARYAARARLYPSAVTVDLATMTASE